MQIQSPRRYFGLAQHYVDLPAMMRLVVEEMTDRDRGFLDVIPTLAVHIRKLPIQKRVVNTFKEGLNTSILSHTSAHNVWKLSNRIAPRAGVAFPCPSNRAIQIRSPSKM